MLGHLVIGVSGAALALLGVVSLALSLSAARRRCTCDTATPGVHYQTGRARPADNDRTLVLPRISGSEQRRG